MPQTARRTEDLGQGLAWHSDGEPWRPRSCRPPPYLHPQHYTRATMPIQSSAIFASLQAPAILQQGPNVGMCNAMPPGTAWGAREHIQGVIHLQRRCLAVTGTQPGQTTGSAVNTCWSNMVRREMGRSRCNPSPRRRCKHAHSTKGGKRTRNQPQTHAPTVSPLSSGRRSRPRLARNSHFNANASPICSVARGAEIF